MKREFIVSNCGGHTIGHATHDLDEEEISSMISHLQGPAEEDEMDQDDQDEDDDNATPTVNQEQMEIQSMLTPYHIKQK